MNEVFKLVYKNKLKKKRLNAKKICKKLIISKFANYNHFKICKKYIRMNSGKRNELAIVQEKREIYNFL